MERRERMTADKLFIRGKDISLIIAILTLIGLIMGPLKKTYQWDQAAQQIPVIQEQVQQNKETVAVVQTQLSDISKQLDQINWQLRRINR